LSEKHLTQKVKMLGNWLTMYINIPNTLRYVKESACYLILVVQHSEQLFLIGLR